MNIKETAETLFKEVHGDKYQFYLRMLQKTLSPQEAETFMSLLPKSGFNSVDRYWREFAPKEAKELRRAEEFHKEFSQAEKNRQLWQERVDRASQSKENNLTLL